MLDEPLPAVLLRWVTFVALVATIGAAAFRVLVLRPLLRGRNALVGSPPELEILVRSGRRVAALGFASAVALVPLALARLVLQVAELRDPADPWMPMAVTLLTGTTWGTGWWLQVGAAAVAATGFLIIGSRNERAMAPGERRRPLGWLLMIAGTVALAAMPSLSGHAAGVPQFTAFVMMGDALHVLGAGAWLGSLACMLTIVGGSGREERPHAVSAVAMIVRAFSPVALAAAALVVTSGVLASWVHLDALASLWETTYGRLLAAKVALFTVVATLGALNWRYLLPRLESTRGVRHLRGAARAELVAALLVLFVTAILVATPLPGAE